MSKFDEARKRLAGYASTRHYHVDWESHAADIRTVLDALNAAERERDEALEVLAGADHTAAKYWRRMTESDRERDELADHLVKTGEDADQYMRERDEALAALDRIRRLHIKRERPSLLDCSCGPALTPCATRLMLRTVPADVLRERDAERWDEGRESVALDFTRPPDDAGMRKPTPNPYRETKEQGR